MDEDDCVYYSNNLEIACVRFGSVSNENHLNIIFPVIQMLPMSTIANAFDLLNFAAETANKRAIYNNRLLMLYICYSVRMGTSVEP